MCVSVCMSICVSVCECGYEYVCEYVSGVCVCGCGGLYFRGCNVESRGQPWETFLRQVCLSCSVSQGLCLPVTSPDRAVLADQHASRDLPVSIFHLVITGVTEAQDHMQSFA